jgi:anti-sigma factor RsiW
MSMDAREEMTCRELVEVVSDYLEGRLPERDRELLETHLDECPYCKEYIEQMRTTVRTLGRLSEDSLEPETRARLVEAFRGWRAGRQL